MPRAGLRLEPHGVAQLFETFGRLEAAPNGSPLYARLCAEIAEDAELLELAARAQSFPVPNVFLAAVHDLLLGGVEHPLAAFYPSVAGAARAPARADPFPSFRAFCLEHRAAIEGRISTRRTQTNEVRRCALLVPALAVAWRRAAHRPLAIVEVGASAGLNLLWDRYGYDYGGGRTCGDPASPVRLACELRGGDQPPLPAPLPPVASRAGIDVDPVDATDPEATRWLRALVWPEHEGRAALLAAALELARRDPPVLIAGDALDALPDALRALPADAAPCVVHSFTLNQLSRRGRARFDQILREHAGAGPLWRISLELEHPEGAPLRLLTYRARERTSEILATAHPHGRWLEWGRSPPGFD